MAAALVNPSDPAPRPAERLSLTVSRLTRSWMRMAREEAREVGLSLPQLFLLGGLRERGPMPVTRWVQMVGASPSATTSLLDGLEAAGYIARSHDVLDRRQVLISLTPKGRRLAVRVRDVFRRRWVGFCAGIPTARLDAAADTLERVLQAMRPVASEPVVPVPVRRSRRAAA